MKWHLSLVFTVLLICVINDGNCQWSTDQSKQGDFGMFLSDLRRKLGLDNLLQDLSQHFKVAIVQGQSYKWSEFERDWKYLKDNPGLRNFIRFIRKITWPCIINSCIMLIEFFLNIQVYLLSFLKQKLDAHIGGDAPFHPWNMLMEKNVEEISFVVFIYALALSLILVKLLSWWNFSVYLAVCFIVYSFGGPYLVFKWLLTVTAACWLMIDFILIYPLQVAICIISMFILGYIRYFLPSSSSQVERTPVSSHRNNRVVNNRARRSPSPAVQPGGDLAEFRELQSRMVGMERKTDLLNSRLEQLSSQMERILQSDDEDGS